MKSIILITGGTGYIGSWIVKELLEKGYTVRLTVRNKAKKAAFEHLSEIAKNNHGSLELWEADLLKEGSYNEAAKGAEAIIHVASPFILKFKDAQKELIDPALLGTRNVLKAASESGTVKKIVLTSSVAAVFGDNIDMHQQGLSEFTEKQFNDSSTLKHQPYSYSKVVAEKEAWEIFKKQSDWKLVVINPSFVMGPSLTAGSVSESLKFMSDMLSGKFFMGVPALEFGFVDVRDVAKAHILALENEKAEGRFIVTERTAGVYELAEIIKAKFPKKYKLPIMLTPKIMLYLTGWMFGLSIKFIRKNVGYSIKLDNCKSINILGQHYTPLENTVQDMINQMESAL